MGGRWVGDGSRAGGIFRKKSTRLKTFQLEHTREQLRQLGRRKGGASGNDGGGAAHQGGGGGGDGPVVGLAQQAAGRAGGGVVGGGHGAHRQHAARVAPALRALVRAQHVGAHRQEGQRGGHVHEALAGRVVVVGVPLGLQRAADVRRQARQVVEHAAGALRGGLPQAGLVVAQVGGRLHGVERLAERGRAAGGGAARARRRPRGGQRRQRVAGVGCVAGQVGLPGVGQGVGDHELAAPPAQRGGLGHLEGELHRGRGKPRGLVSGCGRG
jgi:hypothetical protein